MHDELAARQRAINRRLAGRSVKYICAALGRVEAWFQEPLLQRHFKRPGDLRRELARLQEAVNTQHAHPRLGCQTPAQHRRGLRLRKLPASFVVPTGQLPLPRDG